MSKRKFQKVKRKTQFVWTEEDMELALHEVDSVPGNSIRKVAAKYGLEESTLRFRIKKRLRGEELGTAGRKNALNEETETKLTKCISVVCNLGFSPTMEDIMDIVRDYVTTNGIDVKQFNNNRPGMRWIRNFMKRNKLSHKKAEMISAARKANTSNPFIIYDFYEQLAEILEKNPELNASRIWNCDESGFPTDPSKGKVVSVKGERALNEIW